MVGVIEISPLITAVAVLAAVPFPALSERTWRLWLAALVSAAIAPTPGWMPGPLVLVSNFALPVALVVLAFVGALGANSVRRTMIMCAASAALALLVSTTWTLIGGMLFWPLLRSQVPPGVPGIDTPTISGLVSRGAYAGLEFAVWCAVSLLLGAATYWLRPQLNKLFRLGAAEHAHPADNTPLDR